MIVSPSWIIFCRGLTDAQLLRVPAGFLDVERRVIRRRRDRQRTAVRTGDRRTARERFQVGADRDGRGVEAGRQFFHCGAALLFHQFDDQAAAFFNQQSAAKRWGFHS
jgi:CO/xanthine dehydrogenase Mo-binding subunit